LLWSLTMSEIYSSAVSRVCFPQSYFLSITTKPRQNCAFVLHCLLQFCSKNDQAFAFPVAQEPKAVSNPACLSQDDIPRIKCVPISDVSLHYFLYFNQSEENNHKTCRGSFFLPQYYFRVLYASIG